MIDLGQWANEEFRVAGDDNVHPEFPSDKSDDFDEIS